MNCKKAFMGVLRFLMMKFTPAATISIATLCLPPQAGWAREPRQPDLGHAEWLATGGHAWDSVAGIVLAGTMIEGGVPGRFEKIIDLRTGYSRILQETGPMRAFKGYDGGAWVAQNGIVDSIDRPALVEDARSQAFIDRAGWRAEIQSIGRSDPDHAGVVKYMPDRSSEVSVSFDPKNHLVTQVVIETDGGPVITTYGDWRSVGKLKFAFRQVQTDNTGEVTTLEIEHIQTLRSVPAAALARPPRSPHGRLLSTSNTSVPFRQAGSHILVSAKVNDVDADVIFDTGAANYFSPKSARRFGLEVSGGLNLSGVGESSTTGGFARANKVSLGAAELRDETVVVAPTPWGDRSDKQQNVPDGFVGYEFFAEFRTTIDYPAHTIEFAKFSEPPRQQIDEVKVPFYSVEGHIYVEAEVDNQRGLFGLDTGDGGTVTLFPNFAKLHNLYQNSGDKVVSSGGGVGGKVSARHVTLSRFTLAGAEFHDLPASLSQNAAGAFASRSLAGNLGGGILRCFRITIDYSARTVSFQADPEYLRDCAGSRSN